MDKFKKSYENNKYKILALTLKEELELLEGSYSVSDIHNSFGYLFKNMEHNTSAYLDYLIDLSLQGVN